MALDAYGQLHQPVAQQRHEPLRDMPASYHHRGSARSKAKMIRQLEMFCRGVMWFQQLLLNALEAWQQHGLCGCSKMDVSGSSFSLQHHRQR
jgi:hypothetical protein